MIVFSGGRVGWDGVKTDAWVRRASQRHTVLIPSQSDCVIIKGCVVRRRKVSRSIGELRQVSEWTRLVIRVTKVAQTGFTLLSHR